MQVAVLGSGSVGRTLSAGLAANGHSVVLGTRDPDSTVGRDEIAEWLERNPQIGVDGFGAATASGEIVINATNGAASVDVISTVAGHLRGKVLIDAANPLDFSQGFPPTLIVKDTDSLAETLQRTVREARVVKTFNTVNASVMTDPASVGDGSTSIFVAGNDDAAKEIATGLLREFGWQDIIDLGDLTAARAMEMYLPLWIRTMSVLGSPKFNIKVVR